MSQLLFVGLSGTALLFSIFAIPIVSIAKLLGLVKVHELHANLTGKVAIVSGAFCCLFATDAVDTHPEDKGRISDSESGHDEHLRIQRQPFCRAGGRANRRQCQ